MIQNTLHAYVEKFLEGWTPLIPPLLHYVVEYVVSDARYREENQEESSIFVWEGKTSVGFCDTNGSLQWGLLPPPRNRWFGRNWTLSIRDTWETFHSRWNLLDSSICMEALGKRSQEFCLHAGRVTLEETFDTSSDEFWGESERFPEYIQYGFLPEILQLPPGVFPMFQEQMRWIEHITATTFIVVSKEDKSPRQRCILL